jgi:undecaprenyl-phosphate galactose phosphotransferase/putative colanic acid biosynthesis UDP-glucose lipid carrier transferase
MAVRGKLSDYEKYIYSFLDLLILNVILMFMSIGKYGGFAHIVRTDYIMLFLFMNLAWLVSVLLVDSIVDNRRMKTWKSLYDFFRIFCLNVLLTLSFTVVVPLEFSKPFLYTSYGLFLVAGLAERSITRWYLLKYREKGFNFRRVVVVGFNEFSQEFVREITTQKEYGYKFFGYFDHDVDAEATSHPFDSLDNIYNFLLENKVDEVYVSMPMQSNFQIKALIKFCHLNFIKVHFLNEIIHALSNRSIYLNVDYNGLTPIVSLAKEPLEAAANRVIKRTFDVVFSGLVILLIFPWLYPIVAILIKLESPGPVFFKQLRSGINCDPFWCYKFRTMTVNADSDTKQATRGDSRITRIGEFLRKTSIDELPQFINVLKGEMSVVGPRPHMIEHTKMYSKLIKPFTVRHWVKPGITGLAQAKGFRGETKEVQQMMNRVKMDVFYIQHWSFFLDTRIVWQTFWNMVTYQKTGF